MLYQSKCVAVAALAFLANARAFELPCDIFNREGTPCVAAHSLVRALYSSYAGRIYQVIRASDNSTLDITVLSPGGVANAAAQDKFCTATTCFVHRIYDQVCIY